MLRLSVYFRSQLRGRSVNTGESLRSEAGSVCVLTLEVVLSRLCLNIDSSLCYYKLHVPSCSYCSRLHLDLSTSNLD